MDDKNKKPVKPILSFEEMSNEAYSEKDKMPSTYSTGVATDVDLDTATELLGANNRPQFGIENFNSNIDNAIKTKAYQEAKLKAEEQGIGFEIIGALNQLVVGELVGGMLEASGHLFDWDQVKTLEEGGITFGTFLSGIGSDIKEWTQEVNPINVDPDVEAKGFGTGLNHGTREWFLSGLPSVGSALSILVPVAGEAKLVSILGEGIQATKGLMALNKLGKSAKTVSNIIDKSVDFFKVSEKGMSYAAKLAVKGTHRAAVSTHIEAGMEAVGAYKEEYKRLINAGIEESEAKKLAAETGDFVYKYNWANFMTNFLQQMVLLKTGPNLASGVVGAEEAAAAGEKKIVGRLAKAKEYAKQMGSEGFEEAYQFGVTEEGKYYSDVKAGITEANTFGERLGKYVKDGELWSSAFFGGLGGAVFHKYGNKLIEKVEKKFKGLDDIVSTQERKIDDLKTQHTRALIAAKNLAEAKKSGNPELILNAENAMSLELGVNSAINGTLDYMLNRFNNLKHMSKEEREANGIDADFISNIDRHSKNIIKAAEMYAENQQQYGPDLAGPITHREYQIEKLTEELPRVKEQYDSIVTKLPRYSESTIEGRKLVDKQVEIAALEKQALFYKLQSTNAEVTAMQADTIQKNITYLEDKIENLKKEYAEIEPGYSSDLNDADRLILNSLEGKYGEKLRDAKFRSNMYEILIKNNTDELNFITSKKGQEEMTMRAKAAAAANEARKKNKEAVDESEEAEMQGVVDEVEIPMNGPGLEAAIADGSLTEEIINNHPKLKKIWDDYKNGVVEDTEEDFNEDSATTLNFENETTKEDSNTANENITIATTINEVETPVNIETEEEIVDMEGREFVDLEEINELTNISSLAYKSSNNVQAYDKDKTAKNKAVSNWLENPLNITEDDINAGKIEVRFSIDKEHDMFRLKYKSGTPEFEIANALSGIEEGKARLPENIGKVPIKATFYKDGVAIVSNGQTMEIFLHDHDYENYKDKESAATEILRQKEIIVSNLIKGITMSSVITKKSNGHIRTAKNKATNKFDTRPLTDIFKDLDSVSFLIGSNDKKVNTDKVVDPDVEGVKTTNGAIYVKVKTANGNTFPLRTNVSNISVAEANLIHTLYAYILNNDALYKQNISPVIASFIQNNEDLRIKNMSSYLNFDNLSYEELLNHLVFNGYEKTKHAKESKLFHVQKKENKEAELVFGNQMIIASEINKPTQKEAFIKYLTENRRRQVSAKYLSNKEFGKYLITSGILTSNVVPTETGKLFVQPRVDYSPNFKVVKKEVKNTQQTTTPVSDITAKKPENRTIPVSKNNPILVETFKETIETKDQTIDEDDFENDSATFLKFEVAESLPSEQPISPDKINKTVEKENAVDNSYDENLAAGMKLLQEGESDIDPFKAIDIEDFKAITPNYDTFDKEVAHIKSLLPEKIAIKLYDDYIQLLKNGNVAVGLFKDNMIHLSRRSPKGTGYHEAFHAVFRTMLSDTERAYLQKEAVKNYVAPTKEDLMKLMIKHQIQEKDAIEIYYEEAIADEFMDYMNGEGKSDFKYAKGIKGFFERLLDWFKSVFSSKRTTRKLFNDISTGKYKSKPVKLSRGVAYKEFPIKGAIHAWDRADVRDITKQLTFILLTANQSTVKNLGDLKNIKIDSIKSELQKSMARNAMAGNEELSHRANRVLSDLTFFVSKVKDYMFEMGISEKIEQVDSDNNDGSVIYKSSYETSGKDSAAQEVKLMVALTPKFKSFDINSTKNKDYDLDTYLGFPKFENFNNVWNKLEKNLTGLVDITRDGKIVSSFDLMIEKLTEKSMYHPSLGFIRNKLLGSNTHFKSQFHYSFSRFNGNYADALISGTAGNMSYRIADSNSFDKIAEVANIWSNNFVKNFGTVVPDGVIYNQEALDYLKTNHLKLNESLISDRINKKLSIESKKLLKNELEFLGIQLSKKAYGALIRQKSSKETNDVELNLLQRVSDIYDKLNSSLVSSASYTSLLSTTKFAARSGPLTLETNHILDQRFFKEELASYEAEFLEIIGENTVPGPDGTNIWISQDHNMMSILKSKIKLGDLSELESLSKLPYNTSSKWIKTLLNSKEARNNFDLVSYNNYKLLDNTDGGDKAKNLKDPDKINDSVNKHLSGYYVGLAEADKSQQFYIKGFDLENSQVMSDGEGGLTLSGGNAANILMSYFSDEIARMEVAFNHLNSEDEAIKIKEEDKLIYYHYNLDKNGNKTEGNWRKSYMFPNMDLGKMGIVIYSQVKGEENKILKVNKISNLTEEQKTELKNYIKDRFLELVNKDLETLSQYGIIKNDNGVYKNITIDATKVSKNYNNNVVHAVGDFTLNSIIGNIEFTKLFTQDPALFKFKGDGFEDFRKRIPVISASGKLQRIFNEGNYKVKESYNSAVIENIISPSKYFSDPKNIKIIALASGLTEEEVKESFSAYKEVNETDAQAWITIDLYRERLLAWGKWTDPLEEAFKRIKSGNETIGDNLMFAQPLKTVHAEKLILNGVATMQYNKQSEAVLLPGVVGKMKINNLLKAMEAQGIDHVITLDGKKVGARGITKITDDNNIILSSENIKLNSTTLSNRSLFLQQDLPSKGIKPTLVGTQMTKNVLSMLILTNDYQGIKGLELYNQYHDTISNLSNLGLIEIHKKLGFDTEKDMITNHTKFNESMVDAIKDNASTNVLDALQAGLELDTIFQYKTKMQNKTAAQITKTTVKQKQLGGSMIYTSSFGFESLGESVKLSDKLVKDEIFWFKKPNEELNPARLVENTTLNSKENSIFVELQKDLTEVELTKEQQDLLEGKNIKELEPTTDNLGLLIKVHCK